MRTIDTSIWRDEWFMEQYTEAQLLWLGIITKIADDQGRFTHKAALIKADLFPTNDKITVQDVNSMLVFFVTDGRLFKYEAGDKTLLQIVNWWKYQNGANFMNASKYPAPDGWTDCYRYHGKGNAEIKSSNWSNKLAGFVKLPSTLDSPLPSQQDSGNASNDVNDDVKDDIKHTHIDADPVAEKLAAYKYKFNPNSAVIISGWKQDFPDDIILRAIEEAHGRGVNSMPYVDKIIIGWKANGVPPTREEQIAAAKANKPRAAYPRKQTLQDVQADLKAWLTSEGA